MSKIDLNSMPCIERHKKIWEIYNHGLEYFRFLNEQDNKHENEADAYGRLVLHLYEEYGDFIKDTLSGEIDMNDFEICLRPGIPGIPGIEAENINVQIIDPTSKKELFHIYTGLASGVSFKEISSFIDECNKSIENRNNNKDIAFSEAETEYVEEWKRLDKEYVDIKKDAPYRDSSVTKAKFQDLIHRRGILATRFVTDILTGKIDKNKFYIKLDEGGALLSKTYSRIIVSTPDNKKSLAGLFGFRLYSMESSFDEKGITLKGFLCNCVDEVCSHDKTLYKGPVKAEMVDEYLVDKSLLDIDPPKVELRPIKQPIGGEIAVFPPHIIRIDDVRTEAENELKKAHTPDKKRDDTEQAY